MSYEDELRDIMNDATAVERENRKKLFPVKLPYRVHRFNDSSTPITQLTKRIARGAFGYVYIGVRGDERVAIKQIGLLDYEVKGCLSGVLNPKYETKKFDEEPCNRTKVEVAQQELNIMHAASKYKDGLKILECFKRHDSVFIVLEYCVGSIESFFFTEDIHQPRQDLPVSLITYVYFPIMKALEDLHQKGFVHLDIKPANILLDQTLTPKLCDFGAAIPIPDKERPQTVGTRMYTAPEVTFEQKMFDERADTMSIALNLVSCYVGITEYTTGQKGFEGWLRQRFERKTDRDEEFENFVTELAVYDETRRPKITDIVQGNKYFEKYLENKDEDKENLKDFINFSQMQDIEVKKEEKVSWKYNLMRKFTDLFAC